MKQMELLAAKRVRLDQLARRAAISAREICDSQRSRAVLIREAFKPGSTLRVIFAREPAEYPASG